MDPELAKALAAVVPGLPSLIGTLIGAMIGGTVSYVVARQSRHSALELDRQKARREDLLALLGPLRSAVAKRHEQVINARAAIIFLESVDPDMEPVDKELVKLAEAELSDLKLRSAAETGDWAAAGDPEILELFHRWRAHDQRAYSNMREIERQGSYPGNNGEMQSEMRRYYTEATVRLTDAISRAIHGTMPAPVPLVRPTLRQRLAGLSLPWRRQPE